ncbi:retinaldehyde-binding protein 1 [Pieris rapae]|uniref:retinaldehyde-binding protein 1 n=1 Tax=Pieris rapae TaxID=64459 RepID=UPI001E27EF74|nr:retinaldehyde-binding protein 1 [Pieris rapae]
MSRSYSLRNKEAQYTGCQGQGVIIIYKSATVTARAHIYSFARARSALYAFRVFFVPHVIDGVSIMTSNDFRLERNVELSEETKAIAEEELRETPERVKEALERLRELLKENKDLYFGDDDEILTIFLRPCKWYPESAIALMRRVAEFKKENASLLDGLLPEHEIQPFLEHKVVNVLKGRDHKGRRVLVVNVGASWDPKKVTADQLFRLFYLIHEAAMLEPESQVRGTVVIMDFHNMGWTQTWGLTPSFSKRLLTFIQDAMPLRLKEVHFVKEPMLFSAVWKMFKPFIREKLKNRIYFHGSKMSSLHKQMNPSHLPADYGGDLPAIDYSGAEWYPVINEILPHIHNWNSYGFAKDS